MKRSAGVLLYRLAGGALEVLLVHPGGPYFRNKDHGSWSLPKGLIGDGEDALAAARRELTEETGATAPEGPVLELGEVVQKGGKRVTGFAIEGDWDPDELVSQPFEIEWPPRSGRRAEFPEVDRAAWFGLDEAAERILPEQAQLLVRLAEIIVADASRRRASDDG
ncbi:MAG: NUDIX domain-containing protein [Thermoanaerobaculia bacterium]|nr:NUDIX domain-containing protein [Thermoanaerobaculia bacterium]